MNELEKIFLDLGLDRDNGLFVTNERLWVSDASIPNRIKRIIEQKKIVPDAFFCFDNKPMIMFFHNPDNKQELHKAIWNFNESPIVIIVENSVVEIYNGFHYLTDVKFLDKLGGSDKLNDFNYFELVTGKAWEKYEKHLDYKKRIDYHLLKNIGAARKELIEKHKDDDHYALIANAIIGKCIFVRYLIDRKVKLNFEENPHIWTNIEFCELLDNKVKVQNFFNYLDNSEKGFNGHLFPLTQNHYNSISEDDYTVLKRLLSSERMDDKQMSLFEFYDFSIIPIEFVSNVYELFIGKDNQKKQGAYYTPLFLVEYILKETVERKLNADSSDFNCRVLDPACGSGIFLVETLRKIIERYIDICKPDKRTDEFKIALNNLVKNNIFGIDIDISAVHVAVFSIYLTLLDYLEPPEIESFKFPILLNKNFFKADFFEEDSFKGQLFDARDFEESISFDELFKDIEFDFIIGNPPWKGNGMDEKGDKYLANRKKRERKLKKKYVVAINNNELAEGFVLRVSDFCCKKTQVSFIIRSSSLYNLGYSQNDTEIDVSKFRQYWLEEFYINKIFELAPVRHEVFEKSIESKQAIAPAAVIFYRYANGESTDKNFVEHITLKPSRFFSLFKIFTINRADCKYVKQKMLKNYDWLWKVLVYGSYLDFNFIKRLKEDYPSVKNIISNKQKFIESTGLHSRSNPLQNLKDTHLIDHIQYFKTKAIDSFYIDYDRTDHLEKDKVDIVKDMRIYSHPMLLIREGIDMNTLTAKCSIARKDMLFKDSITSIKVLSIEDVDMLNNISAIFSTFLFSYYAVNTFASIGIERERVKNYNKYSVPYLELDVSESINKIESANQSIHNDKKNVLVDNEMLDNLDKLKKNELANINQIICNKLEISDIEKSLIDYSHDVNRNLIIGNDNIRSKLFSELDFKDDILRDYASVFIKRFKDSFSNDSKKFTVEIWHTNHIVGMFFKVVSTNEFNADIIWVDKRSLDADILISLSSEKITDRLFVQKDFRGFEKDYFYIFKPNEKRLWHKAIGYLDVNEFSDALLTSGRNTL
ncbi:MAG: N-6 DNA methylase [Ignavibacteriae bacterium]|nr:N-6 DNA methylase [Ignavibacteriota bacterium]